MKVESWGKSFARMDWLDLLEDHGTLKSLLQEHSLKTSILRCSAFVILQLSHPYMTIGKMIALTMQTFVGKVIFPTQGLNPGLPYCRQILYQLSHNGSPRILEWVAYPFSSRSA